jgi:hypothetical protein
MTDEELALEAAQVWETMVEDVKPQARRILRTLANKHTVYAAVRRMFRPETLEDAVSFLLCTSPPDLLAQLKALSENELFLCHHVLGQTIRNEFRLHYESKLVKDCCEKGGRTDVDADAASSVIIRRVWDTLQDG